MTQTSMATSFVQSLLLDALTSGLTLLGKVLEHVKAIGSVYAGLDLLYALIFVLTDTTFGYF